MLILLIFFQQSIVLCKFATELRTKTVTIRSSTPMKKFAFKMLVVSVALSLSSCATIVDAIKGGKTKLCFEGNIDTPVSIQTKDATYQQVMLPQEVKVSSRDLNVPIAICVDSVNTVQAIPGEKFNNWVWGNFMLGGVFGVLIDVQAKNTSAPRYNRFYIDKRDSLDVPVYSVMCYPLQKLKKQSDNRFRRHEIECHFALGANVDKGRMRKMEDYLEKNLDYEQGVLCGYLGAASVGLHYSYYLSRKWAIGFDYAYAAGRSTPYWKYDGWFPFNDAKGCDVLVRSHLLMPSIKHLWWEGTNAAIYSKAALGLQHRRVFCNFYDEEPAAGVPEDNRWLLAYQFSALGAELGSRWLRAYFELGYGNEGVVLLGFRTRF